jgi:polar amino acid transport system substrate-binding protein
MVDFSRKGVVVSTLACISHHRKLRAFLVLFLSYTIAAFGLVFFSKNAAAQCSRPIAVPASASGLSLVAKEGQISGIVPEFLSQVASNSKCSFVYSIVPKNRQESLFEAGRADLLVTAIKTERRDKTGLFIPLIQLRATLISIAGQYAAMQNMNEMLKNKGLRLAIVRGYDYGPAYQTIVSKFTEHGRIVVEPDAVSVARTMRNDTRTVTIMAATIFSGIVQNESVIADLKAKVHYEHLNEISWTESGIYISKISLPIPDQVILKMHMENVAKTDLVWKAYQHYYPNEVIKIGLRPRDAMP